MLTSQLLRGAQVWPIILLNLNLPSFQRIEAENMILVGVIPGHKSPWDIDSFLRPLMDEMKLLLKGINNVSSSSPLAFFQSQR